MTAAELAFWQRLLRTFDATVAVTGEMDEATRTATEEWQRGADVEVTGRPDAATWAAAADALAYIEGDEPEARAELAEGDRGRDVAYLQRRLNAHGFGLAINGVYDRRTRQAVERFQAGAGVDVHGVVDAGTWRALG